MRLELQAADRDLMLLVVDHRSCRVVAHFLPQTGWAKGAMPESVSPRPPQPALATPAPSVSPARLTPREQDILWGVAKGLRYADIASALSLSVKTIPGYIKALYRKLGVNSRSEAVFEALQQRLIDPALLLSQAPVSPDAGSAISTSADAAWQPHATVNRALVPW